LPRKFHAHEPLDFPGPVRTANNSSLEPFAETSINALLDNQDLITSEMMHLGRKFPWLLESLINERDQYMVLELEQVR
jgi:pheromone shutdown protein TraB